MISLGSRFLTSTRGRLVALLRRGARTVDELATAVGLTDNAIRNHLATLERDGVVKQEGVRRGPGAGKPAVVYQLHPDTELLFSTAYAPVLRTLIDVLATQLPAEQTAALLRQVGHRLAKDVGGAASGDLPTRVHAAAAILTSLGGDVDVIEDEGALKIRGCGCPLSAAVAEHPEVCRAVETMVGDVAGATARSQCEHGQHPRCRFAFEDG